jgi:hypothetical protein
MRNATRHVIFNVSGNKAIYYPAIGYVFWAVFNRNEISNFEFLILSLSKDGEAPLSPPRSPRRRGSRSLVPACEYGSGSPPARGTRVWGDEDPLRPFGPLPPEGEDLGALNLPPLGEVPAKPG